MKTFFRILIFPLFILVSRVKYLFGIKKGKIDNGIYYSHLNNFSVPLPDWKELKIQDGGGQS
jgi:hypothetical protein